MAERSKALQLSRRGLAGCGVRIPLKTYIFILNFSLPPRSEQVNGAVANEIKHVHSPEVIVVLDPRYDLSYKALYISTCSIALSINIGIEFFLFVSHGGMKDREDPRVNFEKRFAHYEIYMWTLCHPYLHQKQTSRIKSLNENIECWWFVTQALPLADPNSVFLYRKYQRNQWWCQMARAENKWSKGSSITAGFCPNVSTRVEKTDLIDKVSTSQYGFPGTLLDFMCSFEYFFKTHAIERLNCWELCRQAFLRHIVWFGIPNKGPIPESRVWYILSIQQG